MFKRADGDSSPIEAYGRNQNATDHPTMLRMVPVGARKSATDGRGFIIFTALGASFWNFHWPTIPERAGGEGREFRETLAGGLLAIAFRRPVVR